jgi:hypothetical protein
MTKYITEENAQALRAGVLWAYKYGEKKASKFLLIRHLDNIIKLNNEEALKENVKGE